MGKGNCGIQATLANRNGLSFTLGNLWASYLQIYNLPRVCVRPFNLRFLSCITTLPFREQTKSLGPLFVFDSEGVNQQTTGIVLFPWESSTAVSCDTRPPSKAHHTRPVIGRFSRRVDGR